MNGIVRGAVDCDVHVEPASFVALHPYLERYWIDYFHSAGFMGGGLTLGNVYPPNNPISARAEVRAAGSFPPREYATLKAQLLDVYEPRHVIVNSVSHFLANQNPYFQAALTTAVNRWMRAEFLDRDERLRASIAVPLVHPEAAAAEIDRVGDDPGFVQVLLPIRSDTPWGNLRWRPIYDAAARHDLPVAFHAWGRAGAAPTTTGYTKTFFEDYVMNGQLVAPAQLLSLLSEGVFERHENFRIVLAECGFNWVPSLTWQFDKDWKSLWREVPWLKKEPADYLRERVRATTAPARFPSWVSSDEIGQLARMLGAGDFLLYASDFPHDHGDDGFDRLLGVLGPSERDAVLRENAAAFFRLPQPA